MSSTEDEDEFSRELSQRHGTMVRYAVILDGFLTPC
mgnify:CR=1 FL=1